MHEIGYCDAVAEAALARAGTRRVEALHVSVGALHRIVPAAFAQAFAMVASGTSLEGAEVEVGTIPASVTCGGCGHVAEVAEPVPLCARCGGAAVTISGGDEVVLTWLRYAED